MIHFSKVTFLSRGGRGYVFFCWMAFILCYYAFQVVENSDVIIEVLDSRDPIGCRCLEMEKTILDSGHKKIVLLLNKIGM